MNKPLCMTKDCGKVAQWKGLCRSCYGQALRLIEQEKTTWEELMTMGLCVLDQPKPFLKVFMEKKNVEVKIVVPTPIETS